MTLRFDDSIVFDSSRSGLPCRFPRCRRIFTPARQDDLEALRQAVRERNAHEAESHEYEHVHTEVARPLAPTLHGKGRMGRAKSRS